MAVPNMAVPNKTIVLIGGGWDEPSVYAPFVAAAGVAADGRSTAGAGPTIACVVLDEGDGAEYAERFGAVLTGLAACRPRAVLITPGESFDVARLAGADGLLIGGGLTPAYARSLAPAAPAIRAWLGAGRPYAGFSAGAAVAAGRAIVGGYRHNGRAVCPADAGEDLDELTVADGLGLTTHAVDVHAAQWGTLGRLAAAVRSGLVGSGIAIDENTALVIDAAGSSVMGSGAAHVITRAGGEDDASVHVLSRTAGDRRPG
jgi:cyanophycinase